MSARSYDGGLAGMLDGLTAPLVSVIVPVYNAEQYLDSCLASIANQTYRNLEVILVDDGSTDSSVEICRGWVAADRRFRLLCGANGGPSAARNAGYAESIGQWVWFIDSDDLVAPEAVETLLEAVRKSGADAAVCDFSVVSGAQEASRARVGLLPLPDGPCDSKSMLGYLLGRSIGTYVWQFLIKRRVLESMSAQTLFDEGMTLYEDVVFSIKLAAAVTSICCVHEKLYFYKMNPGSIVHSKSPDQAARAISAVDFVDRLDVDDELDASRTEFCCLLLLGLVPVAGDGAGSQTVRRMLRRRILILRNRTGWRGVSVVTKGKCLLFRTRLYRPLRWIRDQLRR